MLLFGLFVRALRSVRQNFIVNLKYWKNKVFNNRCFLFSPWSAWRYWSFFFIVFMCFMVKKYTIHKIFSRHGIMFLFAILAEIKLN